MVTPEELRAVGRRIQQADCSRDYGREQCDAAASAWKADRIHIEALEKVGRRLLDTLDSCPECNGEPAGKYGHVEGCPLLVLLYPDAAPAKEKSK